MRAYTVTDLSGKGAAADPERWNEINQRVVQVAPTVAMAVPETAAHIRGAIPYDRYRIRIAVPREI